MKPLVRIVFCLLLAGRLPILDGCTESHLPVSDIMTEEHESVEITDPVSLKLAHQYKRHGHTLCILSGEIGGGSTEALICLGISVFVGL